MEVSEKVEAKAKVEEVKKDGLPILVRPQPKPRPQPSFVRRDG